MQQLLAKIHGFSPLTSQAQAAIEKSFDEIEQLYFLCKGAARGYYTLD